MCPGAHLDDCRELIGVKFGIERDQLIEPANGSLENLFKMGKLGGYLGSRHTIPTGNTDLDIFKSGFPAKRTDEFRIRYLQVLHGLGVPPSRAFHRRRFAAPRVLPDPPEKPSKVVAELGAISVPISHRGVCEFPIE
jgi:hypothetical protein